MVFPEKKKYPETVVLSITVHGLMSVENGAVAEFTVPDGMRIIKISAVAPGVCNVTTESEIEKANASIRKVFGSPDLTYKDVVSKLAPLVQSLKTLESDTTHTIRSQLKGEKDTDMSNFLLHIDKGFSIVNYESGKPMINKEFGRSGGEGLKSVDDYKITALNAVGEPDIHSLIVSERPGATMTRASTKGEGEFLLRLSTIVTFLQKNGVKNILLFDFSCSEMTEGTERDIRNARWNLIKEGLHGGKKTETRRRRKRLYGHSKANTHSLFGKQQATRRRKHSRKRPSRTSTNP
jgi:hypothetical protein